MTQKDNEFVGCGRMKGACEWCKERNGCSWFFEHHVGKVKKREPSKELNEVIGAITRYINKYRGYARVFLTICGFEEDFKMVDDQIILHGGNDGLIAELEKMTRLLKENYSFVEDGQLLA